MLRQTVTLSFFFVSTLLFFSLQNVLSGAVETIPADNPYATAIEAWQSFPEEDRQILRPIHDDIAIPDITATPAFQTIANALRAGAQVPTVHWGDSVDQDPPTFARSHFAPAFQIARVGLSQADHLVASDPLAAVSLIADIAALGRHAGDDNFIIPLLHQTIITQYTSDWIGKHLPALPAEAIAELQRRLAALPPGGDWSQCIASEKIYPQHYLDKVLDIAALAPATGGKQNPGKLRMAGLLHDGHAVSISLETTDGSFWIQTGQTRNGIRLLSVDLKRRQALLTHEGRLIRLQLSKREMEDIDVISINATLRNLPKDHPLRNFFDVREDTDPDASDLDTVGEWIVMTQEMMDYYDAVARDFNTFDFAATQARYEHLSENARAFSMNLVAMQKTAARARIRQTALDAAISAALSSSAAMSQTAAPPPPTDAMDPVTKKALRVIPTQSGYILESDFAFPHNSPTRFVVGPALESDGISTSP